MILFQFDAKIKKFGARCQSRRVIFGENNKEIPDKCLLHLTWRLENLSRRIA